MPKKKTRRQKLLDALCAYAGGREPTCPSCGGHNFAEAYVELNAEEKSGFGAFWCEDCRIALMLCRAKLTTETARSKIVSTLPDGLRYI